MGFRVSAPAPDQGYNRTSDWPVAAGAGARIDGIAVGIGGGVNLKQTISAPGQGAGAWHPTVAWMLGFVAVELLVFHMLSRFLNI